MNARVLSELARARAQGICVNALARVLTECARAGHLHVQPSPAKRVCFARWLSTQRMRVGALVQGTCTCHLHCRLVSHRARRRHARLRRLLCNDLPACRGAEPAGVALLRPLANESSFLIMRLTFAINQADSCSSKSTSAA